MSKKEAGAHDAGKPNAPREGNGFHSGRKHPKSEAVKQAVVKSGVGVREASKQNGGNVKPYAKTNKRD